LENLASTRCGYRLKVQNGRPPLLLKVLRRVAGFLVFGLVVLAIYKSLRVAGFQFRWENPDQVIGHDSEDLQSLVEATRPTSPEGFRISQPVPPGKIFREGEPAPIAENASVGIGELVTIDFESPPPGKSFCDNCPVSDEWEASGLLLSFHSWTANSTWPYVIDASNFLPLNSPRHALGGALSREHGLEVGVIQLEFPGRPRKVEFTLYGPDMIDPFEIIVWSRGSRIEDEAVIRTVVTRYRPAGRSRFRSERILAEAVTGLDRISLDGWGPPGHVLLMDDLVIDP